MPMPIQRSGRTWPSSLSRLAFSAALKAANCRSMASGSAASWRSCRASQASSPGPKASGNFGFTSSDGGAKPASFFPKWRGFPGPETDQTVILGHACHARPEQGTQRVSEGEIGDGLGMQPPGAAGDFEREGGLQ